MEKVRVVYYGKRMFSWNNLQDVADDANRPHVGLCANRFVVKDFGGNELRSAEHDSDRGVWL